MLQSAIDLFFVADIVLSFFSAFYNKKDILIDKHKIIACNYLRSWFIFDLISVLPISLIIHSAADVHGLARVARLTRLHRILKMVKLVHVTRLAKQRVGLKALAKGSPSK